VGSNNPDIPSPHMPAACGMDYDYAHAVYSIRWEETVLGVALVNNIGNGYFRKDDDKLFFCNAKH